MTQVYNKDNKILIYNTDCNAMLDKMNETGMKVDCIVTDPPYPTTSRGNAGNSGGMLQKSINMKVRCLTIIIAMLKYGCQNAMKF